ncbi:OmpA family protein [Vibrio quintilis]|uniref:OmpA family protein n=1 Tax=Vibrio quintilis TaxID=1117707 RepID=A0A1M7YZR4_9VIBR|nr:OmpA family protein [Vibrio quintilis]SHO58177.1 OmpA family protein [Vibrio quintilis]
MNILKMNKWMTLFLQVSLALGAIAFLSYCSIVDFYPKNIQFGDGIFLLFIFAVSGILITLNITIFSISASALVNTIVILYRLPSFLLKSLSVTKKEKQLRWMVLSGMINKFIKDNSISSLYFIGLISLVILTPFIYHYAVINQLTMLATVEILVCFIYVGITCRIYAAYKNKNIPVTLVAMAILVSPYLVLNHVFHHALITVMEQTGIRNSNVSLFVDQKYLPVVNDAIHQNELSNYTADSLNQDYGRLDHVDVLFTGVGDTSLISMKDQSRRVHLALPSGAFHIEKMQLNRDISDLVEAISLSCTDTFEKDKVVFNQSRLQLNFHGSYGNFKVGEYEVSQKYQRVLISTLQPLLKVLSENDSLIQSVEIIGLSSEEWKGSKDDSDAYRYNYDLSVKRALAVSDVIFESKELKKYASWLGKKMMIRGELSNHESDSRKVLIRIHLKH